MVSIDAGDKQSVDLSADVGEIEGPEGRHLDMTLIRLMTTVHIASGGHAGDSVSMAEALDACLLHGTRIGAHPSYPDREGFGRMRSSLTTDEVVSSVAEQIEALAALADVRGGTVESVKLHGQLYHDVSTDHELGEAIFSHLASLVPKPRAVVAAGSVAADVARRHGLEVVAEGFADRRYDDGGNLVSRALPDALVVDPDAAATQAVRLVREGLAVVGRRHQIASICVHSDSPGVLEVAEAVRSALASVAIETRAPGR